MLSVPGDVLSGGNRNSAGRCSVGDIAPPITATAAPLPDPQRERGSGNAADDVAGRCAGRVADHDACTCDFVAAASRAAVHDASTRAGRCSPVFAARTAPAPAPTPTAKQPRMILDLGPTESIIAVCVTVIVVLGMITGGVYAYRTLIRGSDQPANSMADASGKSAASIADERPPGIAYSGPLTLPRVPELPAESEAPKPR